MSFIVSDLFSKLNKDVWRDNVDFAADIAGANAKIWHAETDEQIVEALNEWLQRYQPCLFGRLAAKLNLIEYCIITEADLLRDDEFIREKIQASRTEWTSSGFRGAKSGFILFVASPKIATALPDDNLLSLAKKLCSLYLLDEINEDEIYTDEIWLEKPGNAKLTWKWLSGVNYFCSNADGRWWQDHRIPGGLAFSVNSVGHMAKAGGIAEIMNAMNEMLEVNNENFIGSKVNSLGQALEFAMRTINMSSETVSGKATCLIPVNDNAQPACPIKLPPNLEGKDHKNYRGYYHTDITLPSEYFRADVARPENSKEYLLDFSYLYDDDVLNYDFIKMGKGRTVRSFANRTPIPVNINPKTFFAQPREEEIRQDSRLFRVLTQ